MAVDAGHTSPLMKRKLGTAEMCLTKKMWRIPWTEQVSTEEVIKKRVTKRKAILTIREERIEGKCGRKRLEGNRIKNKRESEDERKMGKSERK